MGCTLIPTFRLRILKMRAGDNKGPERLQRAFERSDSGQISWIDVPVEYVSADEFYGVKNGSKLEN